MFKRSSAFPFGGTLGGTPRALAALKGKTEKTHIMATPGSSNPGHEAFLVHLDTLRAAVTDPGGLATALYSRGLIDRLAYQRANLTTLTMLERSQELLSALDGKIAASEAAFDTFLSLISRNPVMEDMCAVLSESRDILAVVEENEPKGQQKGGDATEERQSPSRESSPHPPEESQATGSSPSSEVVKKGRPYKEHCEESFRELKANVAEFVENTTMSDLVEVLEEEQVLDRLKSAILDHL
ncbi:hypothetical protein GBAR_LOCUS9920 [Geodia barretti]|uniref:Uncharacterized protein n=1 Tax=Geodia barretti TaxID=519541 RepID=A0AA35WCB0_GEOBA|nr:hypothetical protein GBAR_LOCUS9920 [Geodia barretti]